MQNSFQRFEIDHLSASSLNLWRSSPGIWAYRYIGKLKEPGNPAMWRGTAVENGLIALLHGRPLLAAIDAAFQSFDLNAEGYEEQDHDLWAERNLIVMMLEQCSKWQPPSTLNAV